MQQFNNQTLLLLFFIISIAVLCVALWQKIRTDYSTNELKTSISNIRHIHKMFDFVPFTKLQQDSVLYAFYEKDISFTSNIIKGITFYTVIQKSIDSRIVAFIEEDVSCPTCRDVRYLVEINKNNVIEEIHFVDVFETTKWRIPEEKMQQFKEQFIGKHLEKVHQNYETIVGAKIAVRHFLTGLARLHNVLEENEEN